MCPSIGDKEAQLPRICAQPLCNTSSSNEVSDENYVVDWLNSERGRIPVGKQ